MIRRILITLSFALAGVIVVAPMMIGWAVLTWNTEMNSLFIGIFAVGIFVLPILVLMIPSDDKTKRR